MQMGDSSGASGASTCCGISSSQRMQIPWDRLGLARFRVVADDEADVAYFVDGTGSRTSPARTPENPPASNADAPTELTISFAPPEGNDEALLLDVQRLSQLVAPTLSDHSLVALCLHYGVEAESGPSAGDLGEVFLAIVSEACSLDKDVVSLLAQLEEEPLSGLFGRILLLPRIELQASQSDAEGVADPGPADARADAGSNGGWLDDDGWVSQSLPTFERRDGQIRMSKEVAETFTSGGSLVVEAGPGTGKTFAYLIPAIERLARGDDARVIISTRTKQLQEQLFYKDLPFLLARRGKGLKVALLKGRENYLCLRRWEILIRELSEGLERHKLRLLAPLARWLWETETGDIEENTAFHAQPGAPELWARLCDSHLHCVEPFCPLSNDCLSTKARRKARAADLAVVNHSLLLNDLGVARRVLGPYSHLIVDEGHSLEESARSAFTATLAPRVIDRLADELTPSRRRRVGFIRRAETSSEAERRATNLVAAMRGGAESVFRALGSDLPPDRRGEMPRLGRESVERVDRLRSVVDDLELAIEDIVDGLDDPELKREGEGQLMAVRELGGLLERLISPPDEETVRWFERDRRGLSIFFTPLEVAPILARSLYPLIESFVLTSATLSVDGDFGYLLRTLGLDEENAVRTVSVASPFSYADSMRLLAPANFPLPTEDGESYADALAELLNHLARETRRKGMVLFTSYRLLEDVRARLAADVAVLAQGVDGPRSKLIDRFRRHVGGMVLLGTDSFWEGVDLPGEQLEYLVVTRLPFAVPTDPVQSALSRRLLAQDHEPFFELSLPRAVLRLRQGVGRLIRTQRDRGVVILTDRRILTKSYGKLFVSSLPTALQVDPTPRRLVESAASWIREDA